MAEEYLGFIDDSKDKKYFTITPNIIINGYSGVENGTYTYIKRRAGEDGEFFEPASKTAKALKISKPTYLKIRNKLEKDKRIKFTGWKKSKTHPIKVFKVLDIWEENVLNYKKKGKRENLSSKRKVKEKTLERSKRDTQKKNPIKKKQYNILQDLINYFFTLKGWDNKEKEFYKKHKIVYARFTRPAKNLLVLCDNDLNLAKKKLKEIKDWAEGKELEWGLETPVKRWFEKNISKEIPMPKYPSFEEILKKSKK